MLNRRKENALIALRELVIDAMTNHLEMSNENTIKNALITYHIILM